MNMKQNQRLLGIDLCRGIATYTVILVHSGDETWGIPLGQWAAEFRSHFYFAVPFFLATSFYFMTYKPNNSTSLNFWKSRFERILIPYVIWTVVYLVARLIVFSLTNKPDRLHELFQDPLSIIFFGGASYHLYFLPLLFSGTFLILFTDYLARRVGIIALAYFFVLSITTYELVLLSGNSFQLGPNIAFETLLYSLAKNGAFYSLLRLFLVQLAWIIKCLPYF